ncbi:MAG: ribosomal protein S18-alanine N-acetyltransferase [Candidatus Caldarchaeales archaeon]
MIPESSLNHIYHDEIRFMPKNCPIVFGLIGLELGSGNYFVVREASEEDLLAVININRICLPENYTYSFFETILRLYPKSFLVAEVDGKIAGYIMCRVERIFSKFQKLRIVKAGHVISIAVLPEYRRMGIATSVIKNAMKILREEYGCSEIFLEVRISNTPAINLYEKLGFIKVDRIKGYYMDGEDAYLMAKELTFIE